MPAPSRRRHGENPEPKLLDRGGFGPHEALGSDGTRSPPVCDSNPKEGIESLPGFLEDLVLMAGVYRDQQADFALQQGKRAAMLRRLRVVDAWLVLSSVQREATGRAAAGAPPPANGWSSSAPADPQGGTM